MFHHCFDSFYSGFNAKRALSEQWADNRMDACCESQECKQVTVPKNGDTV